MLSLYAFNVYVDNGCKLSTDIHGGAKIWMLGTMIRTYEITKVDTSGRNILTSHLRGNRKINTVSDQYIIQSYYILVVESG
jgi:hypothetical protein